MYRVLLADDEGLMLESIRSILSHTFGEKCEIETAKTGRLVIEKAERFHPDIVFMDIHMPGINGIQAMREIRRFNQSALFYIISAYSKFDYAQEAIDLKVEKYITKPVSKRTIIAAMEDAMEKVDRHRDERSNLLKIQEKMEIVIPVVESGFISNLLFQAGLSSTQTYRELLDLHQNYGYICVLEFGKVLEGRKLISPVGVNISVQEMLPSIREMIKSRFNCVISSIMSNRIIVYVPREKENMTYEERIEVVDLAHDLVRTLSEQTGFRFRAGIGRTWQSDVMEKSYREALSALENGLSASVMHYGDVHSDGGLVEEYPYDLEKHLLSMVEAGTLEGVIRDANGFFDWMILHFPEDMNSIRMKVLELVIIAERSASEAGSVSLGFAIRQNYLEAALSCASFQELRGWFLEKMKEICKHVASQKENRQISVVGRAQAFIQEHYRDDLSLDEVSKAVNISPYYFSKIFKEEAGENFIEYLTRIRIEKARELLEDNTYSIKEISAACGYADPNYFSRIFKKQTDMTPSEYRAQLPGGAL